MLRLVRPKVKIGLPRSHKTVKALKNPFDVISIHFQTEAEVEVEKNLSVVLGIIHTN